MTRLILTFLLLFSPNPILAADRPLKAIPLKEGNTCSLACLTIYDQKSKELRSCVKTCLENSRTRGGYPLETPKYSKRQTRPNSRASKM